MTFTWFRHVTNARRGLRVVMARDELQHALGDAEPHRGAKADLPLLCPATFAHDHRGNERVERVHMLGLDIDEPQSDPGVCIDSMSTALGGVEVYAYSTISSTAGAFKLRALVPYDRAATGGEHRASWALVARVLARAGVIVDRACSDPARGFYVWAIPSCGAYFHAHRPGLPWPVGLAAQVEADRQCAEERRLRDEHARRRASRPAVGGSTVERARRYVARMPGAIAGAGGHDATFAVARKLVADFELSDAAAWDVLSEYNGRCEPPWSAKELRHKLESAQHARVRVPMVGP